MTRRARAFALLALAPATAFAVPEPPGYRLGHYRDAVPATLRGATVIHTAALAQFVATRHPVLIDVLPAPTPPADARPGMPRMPLTHRDIPGSLWLPETGRGALAPAAEARFKARLARAAAGSLAAPLVFYCLSRCWMSWNAAKRAVGYGYSHVLWYPDGADGWEGAGFATAPATPVSP